MADLRVPTLVKRVAAIFATDTDATEVDTFISVAATVLVAGMLTAVVTAIVPVVTPIALPVTAGALVVIANRLS